MSEQHVIRLRRRFWWLLVFPVGIAIGIGVRAALGHRPTVGTLVGFAVFWVIVAAVIVGGLYVSADSARTEYGPEGLRFHRRGRSQIVAWRDVMVLQSGLTLIMRTPAGTLHLQPESIAPGEAEGFVRAIEEYWRPVHSEPAEK
jgi:hypothetical protein